MSAAAAAIPIFKISPLEKPPGVGARAWRRAKRADPDRKMSLKAAREAAVFAAAKVRSAGARMEKVVVASRAKFAARQALVRTYDSRGDERRAARQQAVRIYELSTQIRVLEHREGNLAQVRGAWADAVARARELELRLEEREACVKRLQDELDDKEQCLRGLREILEHSEPSEASSEVEEDTPPRPAPAPARAPERPVRRLRPRLAAGADSEAEEEAVGYDEEVNSLDLLAGDLEATPGTPRPAASAWISTRAAPRTPSAPVKEGKVEMMLVVAPKGISQIEID